MDQWFFFVSTFHRSFFLLKKHLSICLNTNNICMCIANLNHSLSACCLYTGFYKNTACDLTHFYSNFSVFYQLLCCHIVSFCYISKTLQLFLRFPCYDSKSCCVFVPVKMAVRDTTCICIFIHTAVQQKRNLFQFSRNVGFCL